MAENSKIEWCDHTLCGRSHVAAWFRSPAQHRARVHLVVTVPTEGNSVGDVKPQVFMIGKCLDVMGMQIAATAVTTPLANKSVSSENIEAPTFVLGAVTQSETFNALPIDVPKGVGTASRRYSKRGAYLRSRFQRVRLSEAIFVTEPFSANQLLGRSGVPLALECRYSALCRYALLHPSAGGATPVQSIISGSVPPKIGNDFPSFAFGASTFPGFDSSHVSLEGHARFDRGDFQGATSSLCHNDSIKENHYG